MLPIL